ncbi:MAG: 6-phosphogluconolactonase [Dermatophilaceae bacterium]|nr:6-phosphogluconolactonase [Actinomycetales bacterium]MBP8880548.1 6-phosphogluconolactonase [Dermatophilaceae bacterium]MBP9918334.1 6-phosphogluconolactonase [Dermatophilaceae bacterium]
MPDRAPGDLSVVVHRDKTVLAAAVGARLCTAIADAQARRGRAHVVLTGGSMGSALLGAIPGTGLVDLVDWSAVDLWWGDERYLPAGDPDRNETQNREAVLDSLPLDPLRVHAVAGPDTSADAAASATAYELALRESGPDLFDVVLLGVGPDAHIASLFPHHVAQRQSEDAFAVLGSPKPPPTRVTMSFNRLGRAREVWFVAAGADKADAICRALTPGVYRWDVPAAGVSGVSATRWLLDREAAALVTPR